MFAQVTLTPTESKKLIAKAIARLEAVQHAAKEGLLVLHPSSSTYFLAEELTGSTPSTPVWVCGVVFQKGTCINAESHRRLSEHKQSAERPAMGNPELFSFSWVIRGGRLETGIPLGSLVSEMGEGDVYVKGVNALDAQGNVGVLFGSRSTRPGGTFGFVVAASRRKKFQLVFPAGLEKLIPVPVREAARAAAPRKLDYSMGWPCGLLPCKGTVVTEVDAIRILSGAGCVPIAAGGLSGAEGAVTLVIQGDRNRVENAVSLVTAVKGARLPDIPEMDCASCERPRAGCSLAGGSAKL